MGPFNRDRLLALLSGGAGGAVWVTGATAVVCVFITLAAFKSGTKDIKPLDCFMFAGGLAAIPLWIMTNNPLWSIVLITFIDLVAFYPTIRKSWRRPDEENSFMYGFNVPRHAITLAAINQYSVTTVLYSAFLLFMNAAVYVMLKARRSCLAKLNQDAKNEPTGPMAFTNPRPGPGDA
jgi:hypothetical protein